jgi:tol-pal system protein YbgF
MMGTLRRLCALSLIGWCGCADTTSRAELADLRHRLDEQARRAAAAQHQIDELENRVFLLTDQIESQKVAALHREPRALPVVRLGPASDGDASASGDGDGDSDGGVDDGARSAGDEPAGAVARPAEPERARPRLRLDGTRAAARRGEPKTLARPPVGGGAEPTDNLGVAPAPRLHGADVGETGRAEPTERSAPAVEPLALYRQAYEDLRAGRHEAAARGFREFVRRFPRHDYADNAQYWLGEVYYDQKRYDEAAPRFRAVVTRWPTGNKAPDALVKLGFSLLALGRVAEARATLREVPSAYPHTEAARLASERLAQLPPTEGSK